MFDLNPRPNRKIGIDLEDYCRAAETLGCSLSMIRAVDAVESAGRGFLPSGRPKILFEGHIFHSLTGGRWSSRSRIILNLGLKPSSDGRLTAAEEARIKSILTISYPSWTKRFYVGGEGEYKRLAIAMELDQSAALKAASWSRYQILGTNHKKCGFRTVEEFVEAMFRDEDNSLEAFIAFVGTGWLRDALRRKDARAFASGYNGPGYKRNQYDIKITNAERKFAKIKIDCRALTSTAPTPIDAVFPADCHDSCVGLNNTSFDDRYLVSPAPDKDPNADGNPSAPSNPTDGQSSPDETPEPSPTDGTSADNAAHSGGGLLKSLSESFWTKLDRVNEWFSKVDVVRSTAERFPRLTSIRSIVTLVSHKLAQVVTFLVALILGVPVEYWLLLVVLIAVAAAGYYYWRPILSFIRKLFRMSR